MRVHHVVSMPPKHQSGRHDRGGEESTNASPQRRRPECGERRGLENLHVSPTTPMLLVGVELGIVALQEEHPVPPGGERTGL